MDQNENKAGQEVLPNQENITGKQKIIVLTEDDKFISRAYSDGMKRAGYNVFTAFDGAEGLKVIREQKPDLILLDMIMPVMNGFEVMEELKKDAEFAAIPVIVLSNLGQDTDVQRCMELGAKDYLIKSNYTMKEVLEKIKAILQ